MRSSRRQASGTRLAARPGSKGSGSGAVALAAASGTAANLPLLPLFDAVLLPGGFARMAIPASGRKSRALLELLQQDADVVVAAVPYLTGGRGGGAAASSGGGSDDEAGGDVPELDLDRLHHTGTAARVLQLVRRTQSGGWTATLEGVCRLRVRGVHLAATRPPLELYEALVEQLDYLPPGRSAPAASGGSGSDGGGGSGGGGGEQEELVQELLKGTKRLFLLIQGEGGEGREAAARVARVLSQQGPARMSDVLGSLVARALADRLALLSTLSVPARLQMVADLLNQMLGVAEKAAAAGGGRARRVGGRPGAAGRGLRLPGLAGGGGLGQDEDEDEEEGKQELAALMQKLKDADPPPEVLRAAQREFKRLQRGSEQHPGYAMSLSYLETLADLPWRRLSQAPQPPPGAAAEAAAAGVAPLPLPLGLVRQRLDEAHYGLDKVKERIVQFVAVQRLRGWDARAPILCFIGPPGVGKTSLARSIAEVLGRPFQRISLGGVRDEAEIRGHRRTYVGAMPGRLIQALRKAGARDPLLLLDEVDKMGRDARGDPAAALLEVLDPEQNAAFVDTYLALPLDLSAALFVATANRGADIPPPLLDRLEVVQLSGYTQEEKVHIAERHLIPRLLAEHGLHQGQLVFPADAVRALIEGYTSEAGVRSLSRCLAAICRHVAVQIVQEREQQLAGSGSGGGLDAAGPADELGGSGGGGLEQDLPPPLEEAAARAAALAAAAANQASSPPTLSLRATRSRPLAQQQRLPMASPHGGGRQLWEQLQPLAAAARSSPASLSAASRGLAVVLPHGSSRGSAAAAAAAPAAPAAAECSCAARRQPRWFSWLRWPRQDSSAEPHPDMAAGGEAAAAAAGPCACGGSCSDHDCCCSAGRDVHGAAAGAWGHHAGLAADSSSWEASWRQSAVAAAAREAALVCGPGSMQILRPAAGSAATGQWLASSGAHGAQPTAAAAPLAQPAARALDMGVLADQAAEQAQQQQAQQAQQAQQQQIVVDLELIEAVLGPRRYEGHNSAERVASPGTAAGLVWTAAGGKVQYIECICVGSGRPGTAGQLTLTGQLGDVLEESARIALSWVRAHATALGLPGDASCPSRKWDVHIHLPAGAVPKDGPSAGITLAVALVSLFTGRCVRPDAAMTGELTLRGLVLPVGGVKEKLLAAAAAGMTRVLLPARNLPDVQAEVPAEVRQGLEVVGCHRLEDVLHSAFDPPIELAAQPLLARL